MGSDATREPTKAAPDLRPGSSSVGDKEDRKDICNTVNTGQICKEQIWAQNNDLASSHRIKCLLNKKTIQTSDSGFHQSDLNLSSNPSSCLSKLWNPFHQVQTYDSAVIEQALGLVPEVYWFPTDTEFNKGIMPTKHQIVRRRTQRPHMQ